MKNLIISIMVGMGLLVSGCDALLDDEPTCEDRLSAFYEIGCVIAYGGEVVYEWEAVSGCEQELDYARETKCEKHLYDWLKCSDELSGSNCGGCDYHYTALYACYDTYWNSATYEYGK